MSELIEQLEKALESDDGTLVSALQEMLEGFEFTPTRQEAVLIPTEDGGILIPDIDEFSEATNSLAVCVAGKDLSVLDRDTHKWREVKPKGGKLTAVKPEPKA